MFNLSPNFQEESNCKNKQKEQGWRLFHAKDFHSLMYPCFTFCRILGIFPYKINASTFETSKLHYILSSIVICICGIYILITLCGFCLYRKIGVRFLPIIFTSICGFAFGSFITATTFILSGPRLRLLQAILKISVRLPPKYYQKLSRFIHTKDIVGFLYLVGLWIYALVLQIDFGNFHFENIYIYQMYSDIVVLQMDMLYINCVCVLKACFKRINDNLAHMQEYMANDESHIPRQIYYEQRNPFLIMELKALKKQHLMISDVLQMLNIIFSLQLLATVAMTFSEVTINLFLYVWGSELDTSVNFLEKVSYRVYFLSRIAYIFTKIILIVWACETGKNQALQISTFIYDMFNGTTDEKIKDELQLFSLQILHCKNTFSAKGFGTVDAKFFAGIVGSIATYILILFQFAHMSNTCKRNAANNISAEI